MKEGSKRLNRGHCVGVCLLSLATLYSAPAHAYSLGGLEFIPALLGLVLVLAVSSIGYVITGTLLRIQSVALAIGFAVGSLLLGGLLGLATLLALASGTSSPMMLTWTVTITPPEAGPTRRGPCAGAGGPVRTWLAYCSIVAFSMRTS